MSFATHYIKVSLKIPSLGAVVENRKTFVMEVNCHFSEEELREEIENYFKKSYPSEEELEFCWENINIPRLV